MERWRAMKDLTVKQALAEAQRRWGKRGGLVVRHVPLSGPRTVSRRPFRSQLDVDAAELAAFHAHQRERGEEEAGLPPVHVLLERAREMRERCSRPLELRPDTAPRSTET